MGGQGDGAGETRDAACTALCFVLGTGNIVMPIQDRCIWS